MRKELQHVLKHMNAEAKVKFVQNLTLENELELLTLLDYTEEIVQKKWEQAINRAAGK